MRTTDAPTASAAPRGWLEACDSQALHIAVAAPKLTRRERRAARDAFGTRMCSGGATIAAVARAAFAPDAHGDRGHTRRVFGMRVAEPAGALGGRGWDGNARVCLTCQLEIDPRSAKKRRGSAIGDGGMIPLYETADPYDRAHAVTTVGMSMERELVPAGRMAWRRSNSGERERCAVAAPGVVARPRKYPKSSMLQSGVSIDSAFDWLHEARRRLAAAGIAGFGGNDRVDEWELSKSLRLRDIVRGRTR